MGNTPDTPSAYTASSAVSQPPTSAAAGTPSARARRPRPPPSSPQALAVQMTLAGDDQRCAAAFPVKVREIQHHINAHAQLSAEKCRRTGPEAAG